jgi:hypothetical protein
MPMRRTRTRTSGWLLVVKCEICGAETVSGAAVVRSLEGVEHHFCSIACEKAWEELDEAREEHNPLSRTKRSARR